MYPMPSPAATRETLMLWRDESKEPIGSKVDNAGRYFLAKYGVKANHAEVPFSELPDGKEFTTPDGIRIIGSKSVQVPHLYIGRVS